MARNNKTSQWSLSILRIVLGAIFIFHGYGKLFMAGGFKGTVGFFDSIGIPAPEYSALLVGAVEFFGGILLLMGLLTKWTSAALIINMLVALFKVHLPKGFGASEFVLLIISGLVVILFSGSGRLAVGRMLKKKHLQ